MEHNASDLSVDADGWEESAVKPSKDRPFGSPRLPLDRFNLLAAPANRRNGPEHGFQETLL